MSSRALTGGPAEVQLCGRMVKGKYGSLIFTDM